MDVLLKQGQPVHFKLNLFFFLAVLGFELRLQSFLLQFIF
jgi:hypothetical protein